MPTQYYTIVDRHPRPQNTHYSELYSILIAFLSFRSIRLILSLPFNAIFNECLAQAIMDFLCNHTKG